MVPSSVGSMTRRPFICPHPTCTARFVSKMGLITHEKSYHPLLLNRPDPQVCLGCKSNNVVHNKTKTVGKDSDQCPHCAKFWCLVGSCSSEYTTKSAMKKHQDRNHDKTFENQCSNCKGAKIRTAGNTRDQCPNTACKAQWCLVDGCYYDEVDTKTFNRHRSMYHPELPILNSAHGTLDTCKCGNAKTGAGRYAQCPNCTVYWCLQDQCGRTTDTEGGMTRHLASIHSMAPQ